MAALYYTLCETAMLTGVDPHAYLLGAPYTAIARPGAVTYPEALVTPAPNPSIPACPSPLRHRTRCGEI